MKYHRLVTLLLALSFATFSQAQIPADKRAEIDKMLQLTGMTNLLDQMKMQMVAGLKPNMPNMPDSFWAKFTSKMDTSELLGMIIPIYDKYYTLEDLRAVNAFYASPVGRKIISTLPQVMQESMVAGQQWGQKVGEQAAREAIAETSDQPQ